MPDFAFGSLRQSDLPVTLTLHRVDNDREVWREVITDATVLEVPPVAKEQGCPVYARMETADGTVKESRPEGEA